MKKILGHISRIAFASAIVGLLVSGSGLIAQSFQLPANTPYTGFLLAQGNPPVLTGGTLDIGSTDSVGRFTASATSGTLVFRKTDLASSPFCTVVDQTASPVAVYAVTALQITLTTLVSAHVYSYNCTSRG